MALFNKSDSTKKESREQRYLRKRNLNGLETEVDVQVRNIMGDLSGNGFFKAGMALSFAKAEEQAKVTYLSALVEQNWILVKQNDEIMKQNNEIIKLLKEK